MRLPGPCATFPCPCCPLRLFLRCRGTRFVNGNRWTRHTLKIADAALGVRSPAGIDGKNHKLAEYTGGQVLVVLFTSGTTARTSHSIEKRLQRFWTSIGTQGCPNCCALIPIILTA
jgi:hypothetical protein